MVEVSNAFGLSAKTIQSLHSVFSRWPAIDFVVIYGSRAKGIFKEGSDIDLTVVGNLSVQDLLQIETQLDELDLIYKIDLSLFSKIENPQLKEHISRVGKKFYSR